MQTERVTFLTSPAHKASLTSRAAARGISLGEYVRRKTDEDDDLAPEQEAELALLVAEVNKAVPMMVERLESMSSTLRATSERVDRTLREAGLRP